MDPDSSQYVIFVILLSFSFLMSAFESTLLTFNRYRFRNRFVILLNIGQCLLTIALAVIGIPLFGLPLTVGIVVVLTEVFPRILAYQKPALVKFIFEKIPGLNNPETNGVTEEEIIELVSVGQEDGVIHQEEKTMIHGVFDFTDTIVKDVMIPRPDIVAAEKETTLPELLEIIKKEQFSRIPVYDKNIDNILGVVHIKDLIMTDAAGKADFSLQDYLRPTIFLPETKKVNELFKTMKKEKIHLCVVLDEYGGTAGLITMEDLIEEIMGDIQDEHDTEEPDIRILEENIAEVKASIRIDELNETLDLDLSCEEADTAGGMVFTLLGRIPAEGESVRLNNVELKVIVMEGHRVERLRVTKLEPEEEEQN
ncbi:MAG: hemolysin family protein [Clostridia bacterium]|nr:hemolysin family protein [Clostridia bacterium]